MDNPVLVAVICVIVLILLVITAFVSWKLAISNRIKNYEATVGSAEEKAREIKDAAIKEAVTLKKEAKIEAQEAALKTKNEVDREVKERRAEVQRYEKRVLSKEENLDRKMEALEKKEGKLNEREVELGRIKERTQELHDQQLHELEKISGLTSEEAKEYLLKTVEDEVKHETAVMIKEMESRAKEEADKKAKDYVVTAIQKCAVDHVSETTISVVQLPNDEMKGRIIGREGRNIRTLETLTGVDLIIDDTPEAVIKEAVTLKKEAKIEAQEAALKTKNEVDREVKERRAEVQRYEKRVLSKEENLDRKMEALEKKEGKLNEREVELGRIKERTQELHDQQLHELEKISGLTSEEAKEYLLKTVEDEVKHETAVMIKEMESRAKEEADKKAKDYVVTAIQKCAVDHVSETTISVVQLPNDEMKGRIIGREGRNIRTLETLTGVDLIIDDTPEAVILSGFDPVRREVARIALEKLIVDGRIHPARIEEMVEKAQREVEIMIKEEGEEATLEVGVHGIHPELVRLLGKLRFRTSYGQNALKHSIEVAHLSGLLAGEIGLDVRMAKRAGLLHDIGKAVDREMEGSHIELGVSLCRKYKEPPLIINAVEAHHGDVEPQSLIACLVQAADAISAARPGARRETLETYTNRLKQLEDITNSFKGVDKSYAIQAGREVRIMVVPEQVNDSDMVLLARNISKQIEEQMEYPGQIKVNVIRESRVTDYAK